jgi:hypothetical protein
VFERRPHHKHWPRHYQGATEKTMTADHDHFIASLKLDMLRIGVTKRKMATGLKVDPSRVTRALQGDTGQASVLLLMAKELWGIEYEISKRIQFVRKEDPVNPKLPG